MNRLPFWALAVALAVLLPFMAWRGYPQSDGDTLFFLPGAVTDARGGGLVNTVHINVGHFDVTHHGRVVFYPPGFPWFLAKLAAATFGPTTQGVYAALAALNALTLLLAAFAFGRWAEASETRAPARRNEAWTLATAALLALATYAFSYPFGRPDYMATLLVVLGAFWAVALEARPVPLALGLGGLLGLLAIVHPVAALFASALLGLWASLRFPLRTVAAVMGTACVLGVALMVALFVVSPNGLAASLDGIRRHAEATMLEGTWDDPHKDKPLKFLFFHSYATGYGFLVLLGAAVGAAVIRRRWRAGKGTRAGIALFSACLLFFTYHFVVTAWDRAYNLWVFTPVTLSITLACGGEVLDAWKSDRLRRIGFALALVVFLGAASGFVHRMLLLPAALHDEAGRLPAARAKVAALLAEREPGTVAISKSLWILFNDYGDSDARNPIRAFALDPAMRDDCHPRYVVLQQRYTRFAAAPALPGFRLVWDDFTAGKPRLLGLALSPTMPSYRLAFYERIGEGGSAAPVPAR